MIAFFFTMPMSRITPISAMMLNSGVEQAQRQHRAGARRGQRREDRDGMDVALVQDAEHDVDRGQRGEDQHRLVAQGLLEAARGALEAAVDASPACRSRSLARAMASVASLSEESGREVEGDRGGDEGALVIHRQRGVAGRVVAEGRQRHHLLGGGADGRAGGDRAAPGIGERCWSPDCAPCRRPASRPCCWRRSCAESHGAGDRLGAPGCRSPCRRRCSPRGP